MTCKYGNDMNLHDWRHRLRLACWTVCLALMTAGCGILTHDRRADAGPPAGPEPAADERASRSGAELWSQSCTFCHHYLRDPSYYSADQWEVILFHMRVRANLTAHEHRAILEFLKSAN